MSDLKITAKRLGLILLATYCPECLYYLLRLRFEPPNASFGGALFTYMEQVAMAVVGHHLDNDRCLPEAFAPFCDCAERIDFPRHWSKFGYRHKSGVILYGVPDEIFRLADGNLCVIDHKTAINKGTEDPFHPQYRIQIVGYSNIAEVGLELGTVTRGGLFYWQIQHEDIIKDPGGFYSDGVVLAPFSISPLEVEIDYSALDPLLKEVQKIWKASAPPQRREGCKDCEQRDLLFAIEEEVEASEDELLRKFGRYDDVRNEVASIQFYRQARWRHALCEMAGSADVEFASDGMVANW